LISHPKPQMRLQSITTVVYTLDSGIYFLGLLLYIRRVLLGLSTGLPLVGCDSSSRIYGLEHREAEYLRHIPLGWEGVNSLSQSQSLSPLLLLLLLFFTGICPLMIGLVFTISPLRTLLLISSIRWSLML
jgi:hypothetical protein